MQETARDASLTDPAPLSTFIFNVLVANHHAMESFLTTAYLDPIRQLSVRLNLPDFFASGGSKLRDQNSWTLPLFLE